MPITFTGNTQGAPNVLVGITAAGTLTINGGDDLLSSQLQAGVNAGANGTITVTGAGSSLTTQGTDNQIILGVVGTATMTVSAGARVDTLRFIVGSSNTATLNLTGAGSRIVLSNDNGDFAPPDDAYAASMNVGRYAGSNGTLNISNGAVLEIRNTTDEDSPGLVIGNRQGSVGIVNLSGAGSAIEISQTGPSSNDRGGPFLQVGARGDGTLIAQNDAQISLSGQYGQLRISRGNNNSDPGAPLRAPLSEMKILSGADVSLTMSGGVGYGYGARVMIGNRQNANGLLTMDGAGSSLTISGDNVGATSFRTASLIIADQGFGEANITNGADIVINGNNDKRPTLIIGGSAHSVGELTISGAGSNINLLGTNIAVDGGSSIFIGNYAGSNGAITVKDGAQIDNNGIAANSVTVVGRNGAYAADPGAVGSLIVDGNGDASTVFDGGQLLIVGAGWDSAGATLGNVFFTSGGQGTVLALDSGIVRANQIAVGVGGTIGGNSTFDGNVTLDGGGAISPGSSPGKLTINGALNVVNGRLHMEVNGLTAGTLYDQILVSGATTLGDALIEIVTDAAFNFSANKRLTLIGGSGTVTLNPAAANVTISGEPATLGWQLADGTGDLVFTSLNAGTGSATVNFGATSLVAASATVNLGNGIGAGGVLGNVKFAQITAISGTAGNDTFSVTGPQGVSFKGVNGDDGLLGSSGADVLNGGAGNDSLIGNDGADTLIGGAGADTLDGGGLFDTADYRIGGGAVIDLSNSANNAGAATGDVLISIERVLGSNTGIDVLTGTANADALFGNGNNDRLSGLAGGDTLNGGDGDDTITGGGDADILTGGLGNDRFDFNVVTESLPAAPDLIVDFEVGVGAGIGDVIDLATLDAQAGTAGNQAFAFIGAASFSAEGQVRAFQQGAITFVQLNTTGATGAEMTIRVSGLFTLTTDEFAL